MTNPSAEDHENERLGRLLRRCRVRIGPQRTALGPYLRLPIRVGKVITQEEVAEAAGISRQWYAALESDRPTRVSSTVLGRIADVLMMDPVERASLFRLALPELRSASLMDSSIAVIEAFGSLRGVMRRLWAATTEAEALTVVREYAMTQFAPDAMLTRARVAEGCWDHAATGDSDDDQRGQQYISLLGERWGPSAIDDSQCYPLMAQPGELMTRSERDARLPDLAHQRVREALDAVGWGHLSFVMACVRSQQGFVARILAVHYGDHEYSAIERAQLGTLADLTSLALSG